MARRRRLHYCPHLPSPKQLEFLDYTGKEALYGGAVGGGKSDALLMAALQYVDVPGYSAIIFRRTFADLALPGALLDRARSWIGNQAAWNGTEHRYRFPSGAVLQFGYLERSDQKHRYQSAEFQFIGFDELTQFEESGYTYMFSRLRKSVTLGDVPLRMRAATNPGGLGHDWVKERFIDSPGDRVFIPSKLADNPGLDESYLDSLAELDPQTRQQIVDGDWEIGDESVLKYDWILRAEQRPDVWESWRGQATGRREQYIGVDVGRTRDHAVIWTWDKTGDVLWAPEIKVLSNVPFNEQFDHVVSRMTSGVVKCQIDKGYNPQLAEDLERRFPGRCVGVQLSPGRQGQLSAQMANHFATNMVRLPFNNEELRRDLRLVKRGAVRGGAVQVTTLRDSSGHADRFWAGALGLDAAIHTSGPVRFRRPVAIGGK